MAALVFRPRRATAPAPADSASATENRDEVATDPNEVDAVKLSPMLTDLRLPTIDRLRQGFARRDGTGGRTAERFVATLVECKLAGRNRRRIERHFRDAGLLPGKSLAAFDLSATPAIAKVRIDAMAAAVERLVRQTATIAFSAWTGVRQMQP